MKQDEDWVVQPHEPFVVLDTETTGLPHHWWARVVEVGAVLVKDKHIHPVHFHSFVFPDTFNSLRSAQAMRVNGLGPDDFYRAPQPPQVEMALRTWRLELCGEPAPLFSWNGSFDHRMLDRSGFDDLTVHDIRQHVRAIAVEQKRGKFRSLNNACNLFEVPVPAGRHRAVLDAKLAAAVWLRARWGLVVEVTP